VRLIISFFIFLLPIQAASPGNEAVLVDTNPSTTITLSKAEQEWLNKHKKISIAYDGELPPYSFVDKSGHIKGIAVEMTNLLSKRLGITFETYPHATWNRVYKDAAISNKVDVVATMVNRPERLLWFNFTKPYITKSLVVITKSNNLTIKNRSDINGKKVALFKDYKYINRVLKEFPKIKPYFVNTLIEGLQAVSKGKSDAAVIFSGAGYFLKTDPHYADLKVAAFYDYNIFNESMAVRKDWPILVSILEKGLDSISQEEKQNIINKWVPPITLPEEAKADTPTYLHEKEDLVEEPVIDDHLTMKMAAALIAASILLGLWTYAIRRPGNRKANRITSRYHGYHSDTD
jgi:ABC-type amino acid transport substrate-binding protein